MIKAEEKELLDTILLTDGTELKVTMPSIGEVLVLGDKGFNNLQALVIASTGLAWDEFSALPFITGVRIINLLKPAFNALNDGMAVPFNKRLN